MLKGQHLDSDIHCAAFVDGVEFPGIALYKCEIGQQTRDHCRDEQGYIYDMQFSSVELTGKPP